VLIILLAAIIQLVSGGMLNLHLGHFIFRIGVTQADPPQLRQRQRTSRELAFLRGRCRIHLRRGSSGAMYALREHRVGCSVVIGSRVPHARRCTGPG